MYKVLATAFIGFQTSLICTIILISHKILTEHKDKAVQCDLCELWIHIKYTGVKITLSHQT